MPLRQFQCSCGKVLELFFAQEQTLPQRCGFRCVLEEESTLDCRGFGELEPIFGSFTQSTKRSMNDVPTLKMAEDQGMTVYQNQGEGVFERMVGKGPKVLKR